MRANVIWLVISMILMSLFYWKGKQDEQLEKQLLCRGDFILTGMWFTNAGLNMVVLMGGLEW